MTSIQPSFLAQQHGLTTAPKPASTSQQKHENGLSNVNGEVFYDRALHLQRTLMRPKGEGTIVSREANAVGREEYKGGDQTVLRSTAPQMNIDYDFDQQPYDQPPPPNWNEYQDRVLPQNSSNSQFGRSGTTYSTTQAIAPEKNKRNGRANSQSENQASGGGSPLRKVASLFGRFFKKAEDKGMVVTDTSSLERDRNIVKQPAVSIRQSFSKSQGGAEEAMSIPLVSPRFYTSDDLVSDRKESSLPMIPDLKNLLWKPPNQNQDNKIPASILAQDAMEETPYYNFDPKVKNKEYYVKETESLKVALGITPMKGGLQTSLTQRRMTFNPTERKQIMANMSIAQLHAKNMKYEQENRPAKAFTRKKRAPVGNYRNEIDSILSKIQSETQRFANVVKKKKAQLDTLEAVLSDDMNSPEREQSEISQRGFSVFSMFDPPVRKKQQKQGLNGQGKFESKRKTQPLLKKVDNALSGQPQSTMQQQHPVVKLARVPDQRSRNLHEARGALTSLPGIGGIDTSIINSGNMVARQQKQYESFQGNRGIPLRNATVDSLQQQRYVDILSKLKKTPEVRKHIQLQERATPSPSNLSEVLLQHSSSKITQKSSPRVHSFLPPYPEIKQTKSRDNSTNMALTPTTLSQIKEVPDERVTFYKQHNRNRSSQFLEVTHMHSISQVGAANPSKLNEDIRKAERFSSKPIIRKRKIVDTNNGGLIIKGSIGKDVLTTYGVVLDRLKSKHRKIAKLPKIRSSPRPQVEDIDQFLNEEVTTRDSHKVRKESSFAILPDDGKSRVMINQESGVSLFEHDRMNIDSNNISIVQQPIHQ